MSDDPSTHRRIGRRLPVGAELQSDGGVHFRVWAPDSQQVGVVFANDIGGLADCPAGRELSADGNGYFSGHIAEATAGSIYQYHLPTGRFPDPASRFQPDGVHGPSEVIDPDQFKWHDEQWQGVSPHGQVIYEMHIGTFTREGTWQRAMEQLPELAELGITVVELMPVAEFPGRFGWGYDGVNWFAPTRLYGRPDDFKAFVDRAHSIGLGVILDVVYNHMGPDGNYLPSYSKSYFSSRYQTEWGDPLNFDDKDCGPVREFVLANAGYWIDEYHLDGLRIDATQALLDASGHHILGELVCHARRMAAGKVLYFVGENEPQNARLVAALDSGGHGLDALWNDDFHHTAIVALTGKSEGYYMDYQGKPQEFISSAKHGFLYQGQWYGWQGKGRGSCARNVRPEQFINFIQNHDQVANSLRGQRAHHLTSPARLRAMTALLLLGPATPMLFQGQEFAASNPFLYFADHHPEIAAMVSNGRREFLKRFPAINTPDAMAILAEPHAEETFHRCKLDFSERRKNAHLYQLHRDLLRLRREDPVFGNPQPGGIDGAVLGSDAFLLRYFSNAGERLLLINLGNDLVLSPGPEPLLGPPAGACWRMAWSSEDPSYGGNGTPPPEGGHPWRLPAKSAIVFNSEPLSEEEASPAEPSPLP